MEDTQREKNLEIYNLSREVPENAKKPILGGRLKGMTDVNPVWRIKKLTELFGPCGIGWYFNVLNKWTEGNQDGTEVCVFVDIALFIKDGNEWSMPIHGTGGSKLITVEKNGPYVDDEAYKKAQTDALSVACKALGIGADVYWDKDAVSTKYQGPFSSTASAKTKAEPKSTAYPSRAKMLEDIYKKYPKDSEALSKLLECFKIEALEKASDEQLMAVWSKNYGKK